MTNNVLLDIEASRQDSHDVGERSRTEMFISPDNLSTEASTSDSKHQMLDQSTGSSTATSSDKITQSVDGDLMKTTPVNDVLVVTLHQFSEENRRSKVIQITTSNETPSVTHVNQREVTSEAARITTQITDPEKISTEQSSLPVTSIAPSTSEPTTTQTTEQVTTARTSETSRHIQTTTQIDVTSSLGSSTKRVTTASPDVTMSHTTTSSAVHSTSLTSVNNSTYFSTKDPYPHLTSVETSVDSGFNSTMGSVATAQLPLTYIIIGAASLAVIFIVFMCIVVVCICRKRQRKNSGLDEFDYSFDLRARSRRTSNGPARVSYSFTQRSHSQNSFSDIPGALSGLGNASTLNVPAESNMKKAHSNSDNLLTRYNLEPNMYISDEPESPVENGQTLPVTGNVRSNSDSKFDRNDSVMYSTFKRAPKGVELAEGFQGELLV